MLLFIIFNFTEFYSFTTRFKIRCLCVETFTLLLELCFGLEFCYPMYYSSGVELSSWKPTFCLNSYSYFHHLGCLRTSCLHFAFFIVTISNASCNISRHSKMSQCLYIQISLHFRCKLLFLAIFC